MPPCCAARSATTAARMRCSDIGGPQDFSTKNLVGAKRQAGGLAHDDEVQRLGLVEALCHPADVLHRHRFDLRVAGHGIVDRHPLRLHAHQDARDPAVAVEAQGIRAGKEGLGVGQFLFAQPLGPDAFPFGAEDGDGLGHLVVRGRELAQIHVGKIVVHQIAANAIGQAALFAHLAHQARGEAAAPQRLVQDEGGEEIRVVARDADMAE
jgi:hypothetical protein